MKGKEPKFDLSIIVPTKNRADLLSRNIPLLAEQKTTATFELIVVDNGSTDSTEHVINEMRGQWNHIRLIKEPVSGSAMARHTGVQEANGAIIIFIDDDMRPQDDLLDVHFKTHIANPGVCVLGNVVSEQSRVPFERMMAYIYDGSRSTLAEREPQAIDYWSGNVSLARELYLKLGGYNLAFAKIGYGLDLDFGRRLLENGIKLLFVPEAIAFHRFTETFGERLKKAYRSGMSYGYVKESFPEFPIPDYIDAKSAASDRLMQLICHLAASVLEPFDRGLGVPIKPLSFVYDLGLKIALRRGMNDYSAKHIVV